VVLKKLSDIQTEFLERQLKEKQGNPRVTLVCMCRRNLTLSVALVVRLEIDNGSLQK